ncbi:NRDE family protein [Alkalimarinus coralli]|uniref:NRDE family protein n=1 Tax=Alkalimarinus coralli TaxID=2935863 RepID=UPI00202B7FEB|nr:NRDE family protein [Alkalimarinus coralli]
MCTLSWAASGSSYQLFFNRDEQRTRQPALPPEIITHDGVSALMPVDPQGGGSWISVNEYGLGLCLLNFYQGRTPSGSLTSRGQLLRSLACLPTISEVSGHIYNTRLTNYAPFTLVVFQPVFSKTSPATAITYFQWDGQSLSKGKPNSPLTSSSVDFNVVSGCRYNRYTEQVVHHTPLELVDYHRSHDGEKNHRSVCMHRDDAKTVSLSHITLSGQTASFHYQPGSPCENMPGETSSITVRRYDSSSSEFSFSEIESTV